MNKFEKGILTGNDLVPLFSLGDLHISDFLKPGERARGEKYPLSLGMDEETGLVQLTSQPPAELMWGETYWYKSGTNIFMREALKDVVKKTMEFVPLGEKDVWLDIASNDGTLLWEVRQQNENITTVGIDPSSYPEANARVDKVVKDYFSAASYQSVETRKAKVVTCCAMFYDLTDPISFVKEVDSVMDDYGIFVLQLSYTPLMLIQQELGNVCHEHVAYYTLKSLEYVLDKGGFKVIDLELNNVNGGSIRVYCTKDWLPSNNIKTQADRDIATIRVRSLQSFEREYSYNKASTYQGFFDSMKFQRGLFIDFLTEEKGKGKTFWGYGASTKGNTILQWYGLGPNDIEKIAERQGRKVGLICSGSDIPVCSEEEARKTRPDYMVVFPWHFIAEFKEREREYLKAGGKFVVLSPRFQVISYEA